MRKKSCSKASVRESWEAFSSDLQAGEGLLLVGGLYILSLPVNPKLSSKDAALAHVFDSEDLS